jgi:putative tryptophan/tyrosine transport system substrate-binding protein
MRRREFIGLIGGAAAWPLAVRAQQPAMPVIGFLHPGSPDSYPHVIAAMHKGLRETGYVEGRNVAIEYRWARGQSDRLPELAADLVRRQVAVIAALGGPNPPLAAKAATATIPIVFVTATDPVDTGLVTSLNHPNANLTGVHMLGTLLNPKRQELLHELLPTVALVAMLVNPTRASTQFELGDGQVAADKLGQQIRILNVSTDRELDAAFATIVEQRLGGLIVSGDPFFTDRRDQLVLLATRHAIPAIFAWREFAVAGGLMSYGMSLTTAYRQVGIYIGKILKGATPADLPVMQPTELVVNLKAAKVLGLTVPPALLARADEVIE